MGTKTDRIEEIRQQLGLKKKEMADAMGIKANYYSNIMGGSGSLSNEMLIALQETHNVNPTWVLTGEGEMFLDGREIISAAGPSKEQVDRLYAHTLAAAGVAELPPALEYKLKAACAQSYIDNPQLKTLDQQLAATRIYLNLILKYPTMQLPGVGPVPGTGTGDTEYVVTISKETKG